MNSLLIGIFVLVYLAIVMEHPLGVGKSASALFGAAVLWVIYAIASGGHVSDALDESIVPAAKIVFFLMGAMAIVEMIDAHRGFDIITTRLRARTLPKLLWILASIAFLLSAVIDNLTTTIVLVSMTRRMLAGREDRLLFAAVIVIAANAGGAWSPMGDVTTTMLWIGGQVSAPAIVKGLLLPSVVNLLVPLLWVSFVLRGRRAEVSHGPAEAGPHPASVRERNLVFSLGAGLLLMVPVFKTITHLPVFMGVLLAMGTLWIVTGLLHRKKDAEQKALLAPAEALKRIDSASIVFFLGILLAVAVLEHAGILDALASWLGRAVGRLDLIVMTLGLASAVIDNVPLVAAAMGMFPLPSHAPDSFLWEFLAYCAGTGGSILIVGSAAGIAAMGLEGVGFLWYARRISLVALAGYLAGAAVYIVEYRVMRGF
jgi:Na+/H+ antiporter NhaD/arsenite permease-like protein